MATGEKRKRGRPPKSNSIANTVKNPTKSSCTREIPAPNASATASMPPAMANLQYTETENPSVDDIWKSVTKSVRKQMGLEFLHDDHIDSAENELGPEADYGTTDILLQLLAKRLSLMNHAIHQLYELFVHTEKELNDTKGELEKAKAELSRTKLEANEEAAKFKGTTSSWSNADVVRFIESTLGTNKYNDSIRTSEIDGSTLLHMNAKLWKDEFAIEPLYKRLKLDASVQELAARKPNGQDIDQHTTAAVLQFSIPEARKEILVNKAEHLLHEMLINKQAVNGKPQEANKRISPVTPKPEEINNTVRWAARGGETPCTLKHIHEVKWRNIIIQDRTNLIDNHETPDLTRVDWVETPDAHVFQADIPGVRKEEVNIEVDEGSCLQIRGERRKEDRRACDRWHRAERFYGGFLRKFKLPEFTNVDGIKAEVNNGVITVTIPKVPKPRPRIIDVN